LGLSEYRPPPLLTADLFDAHFLPRDPPVAAPLDLAAKAAANEKAVQRLRARPLTADSHARRPMDEDHAGRGLVDVLAPWTAGADERFLEVLLADAERREQESKLFFLVDRDGRRHARIVASDRPTIQSR